MITKENLTEVLKVLGFKNENAKNENLSSGLLGEIYSKSYQNGTTLIKVDIVNGKIFYPKEIKTHDNTTSNFSHPENFVVLECVDRLLQKGYKARHIELEPRWQLGRDAKSGKADILVRDESGATYIIIECKTFGSEFAKEWKRMQSEPSQLISYFQQEKNANFLVLYTSGFDGKNLHFDNYILNVKDNKAFLTSNNITQSYATASTTEEIFCVWSEIYKGEFSRVGIFEKNIVAYEAGKNALCFDDLVELTSTDEYGKSYEDGKYNEFATILRKFNISGKENAFDKLVNLFLCKIYDETHNKENLKFCYRGVTADTFEAMQDRLMILYKDAMKEYLNEEITYVSDAEIEEQFSDFKRNKIKTQKLKEQMNEFIRMLKFYSHSDFSFLEVHNKTLFEKNAEVLKSVIKLFENLRLTQNKTNQLLGNLFELFLQKGMKQDEGQFFTPIQICEFIIYSLPLKTMLKNRPPKVIDYACGAGHFLNTYANIAKNFYSDENAINSNIYGIEKEYRLSKVAKVSAAMYGQNEMHISYADALDRSKFNNGKFDVLVANPPYSVKGFLETLDKKEREAYELFGSVNAENSNAIECFFIERANELLDNDAVAGIILPSSILNKDGVYEKTREIILRNFNIICITELGSNTFGATGTNTVILFLRKKPTFKNTLNSQRYENLKDNIENSLSFENLYLLNFLGRYCEFMGYSENDYRAFLSGETSQIYQTPIFKEYENAFKSNKEKSFYDFALNLEKEKLLFFGLIYENDVLLIKSPTENKAQNAFLGYEWSNRKGKEGLKELSSPYDSPLFERENFENEQKLCFLVRKAFELNAEFNAVTIKNPYAKFDKKLEIPEHLSQFAFSVPFLNCFDFKSAKFNKALNLNVSSGGSLAVLNPFEGCKWEMVKLGEVLHSLGKGKRPASFENKNGEITFYKSTFEIFKCNEADFNSEALIIGDGGTANIHYHNGEFSASDHAYIFSNLPNSNLILKFAFFTLKSNLEILQNGFKGIGLQNIAKSYILDIKIPLPPLEIQAQIVSECEAVEERYKTIRMSIEEYKNLINEILVKTGVIAATQRERERVSERFTELLKSLNITNLPTPSDFNITEWESVKLSDVAFYPNKKIEAKFLTTENYVGVDNLLQNKQGKINSQFVPTEQNANAYLNGDILIGNIRPYLKKIWFADIDGGTNGDVIVVRVKNLNQTNNKFLFLILSDDRFFDYDMAHVKGLKMPRGDKDAIFKFSFFLPPLVAQEQIVKAVEICENKISNLKSELESLNGKTAEILKTALF